MLNAWGKHGESYPQANCYPEEGDGLGPITRLARLVNPGLCGLWIC